MKSTDKHECQEILLETSASCTKRGLFSVFQYMTFPDEDSSSDYVPSDEDCNGETAENEEGDGMTMEQLIRRYQDKDLADRKDQEVEERTKLNDKVRWWKISEDKHRREIQCNWAGVGFQKRFGCAIDTFAHSETRKRLPQEKTRYQVYTFVLVGLTIVSLMELAHVYLASSWAFSIGTWRGLSLFGNNDWKSGVSSLDQTTSNGHNGVSSMLAVQSSHMQTPDYVHTGLHLCTTLSRHVAKSEHDATVIQHAFRACDIAVKYAPKSSREAIETHVLRGDLHSLILHFDIADEDYKAAMTVLQVKSRGTNSHVAVKLFHEVHLKMVANYWTLLYKTKRFKELRHEAKVYASQAEHPTVEKDFAHAVSELATDWLSAFKQKKSILEVLTLQRSYTLRHLRYDALDDDCTRSR